MDATKGTWREIFETEIVALSPILKTLGFSLSDEQIHLSGERFLMTRDKLVLSGTKIKNNSRVIIKSALHPNGKAEIRKEKSARDTLAQLSFARDVLLFPAEILFQEKDDWLVYVTEYVEQKKIFTAYPIEEQFFMILRAFEAQEAFHATTFEHVRFAEKTFTIRRADDYINEAQKLVNEIIKHNDNTTRAVCEKALLYLSDGRIIIDRFANHLVHTDFVPHNFRVNGNNLYVLDSAAVEFGNKYEGWARFLNYMVIHNPKLEDLLLTYLQKNRNTEEIQSLHLMRIYKALYLLQYYTRSLEKTVGDLHTLTEIRVRFWRDILETFLAEKRVSEELVTKYIQERNTLRSPEETKRQKEFTIV